MKTLKKTLVLALVFVMAIGLMTAGAVDFTDKADIQYAEAVEVMTGIGAINGYGDGTFNPDGLITRAEAAKMITYAILTPQVAKNLSTGSSSFTDVNAKSWAAPFIEYCVTKGIVNGRGNGKFDPNGNVTAYELAKMILTAAGYGKNGEYVGSAWSLNVAIDGFDKGLFAGTKDEDLSDAATREEAALYVFNGVSKIDQVVFSADTKSYKDATTPAKTIGEQKYGLVSVATNVNGVTGRKWQNALGTDLCSIVVTENVIATSKNGTNFANLTTKGALGFVAEVEADASYYLNGTYNATASTVTALAVKKGVIVNFINTDLDAKAEKVTVIEKQVATLANAPVVNADGTITVAGICANQAAAKVPGYATLAKNDVVLWYLDDTGVYNIEKAATVSGQMTAKNSTGGIVFAGATYTESGLTGASGVLAAFATYNTDSVAYLDNNGYVVKIEAVAPAAAATYVVLLDSAQITGGWATTYEAKLLFTDGTVKVVPFTKVDGSNVTGITTPENVYYTFTIDANGNYQLTTVAAASPVTLPTTTNAAITPKTAKFDGTNVGNAATVFIVNGSLVGKPGTYVTYTGIASVPAFDSTTDTSILSVNGVAKYVFVHSGAAVVTATPDVVYFINKTTYTYYPAITGVTAAYYEFPAIVKGVATTVKVADGEQVNVNNGLWAVDYTNGFITNADKTNLNIDAKTVLGTGTKAAADGIVTLGGNAYTFDANTVVCYIAANGAVTTGTIDNVVTDANDTFTLVLSSVPGVSADLIATLYVVKVA